MSRQIRVSDMGKVKLDRLRKSIYKTNGLRLSEPQTIDIMLERLEKEGVWGNVEVFPRRKKRK